MLFQCKTHNIYHIFFCKRLIYVRRELWTFNSPHKCYVIDAGRKLPYLAESAMSGQSNAVRCELDNQNINIFQQIIGITMGTYCSPLLADIFLYSYEGEFIQSLLSTSRKSNGWHLSKTSHIDTSMTYCPLITLTSKIISVRCIPPELEIKDTTESNTSASYFDLLLSIGRDGQLHTSLNDMRDDFNFHITNFPFLSSNIQYLPAYCVLLSHNSSDMPGLAPLMNVLFWGWCDFPISFSDKDM